MTPSLAELRSRLPGRMLGLTGSPGVGKSTFAALLAHEWGAAVVPMDGFHYADVELSRRGLLDRKGAPGTFDAEGCAALLARMRAGGDVVAPMFERDLEQPIAGALHIPGGADPVVTEGTYLLLDEPRWRAVREQLDGVWHLRLPEEVRRRRLLARHVAFGRTAAQARAWMESVDDPNAVLVEATVERADLVIDLDPAAPTP